MKPSNINKAVISSLIYEISNRNLLLLYYNPKGVS